MQSVTTLVTVPDMNRARSDLFNQVYKRGLQVEEFDVAYEWLRNHSEEMGLKYYPEFRTYGPANVEGIRGLLKNIKYSRFLNQFNQGAAIIRELHQTRQITQEQFDMLWTLLMHQADFQGYVWNQFQLRFYES